MSSGLSNTLAIHQKTKLLTKLDLNLSTTIHPKNPKLNVPSKKINKASEKEKSHIIQTVIGSRTVIISIK